MTNFWANWLKIWCWGVLAFGMLLVTAAIPPIDGAIRALFAILSDNVEIAASFDLPAVKFGLGLQGAITMGWAITMFAAMSAAHALGATIWRTLAQGIVVWYLVDSTISVSTGFALNAGSNTVLLVLFLIPVLASGVLHEKAA